MTYGTQHLATYMLEHIITIFQKYPIFIGEYAFGQKVKCVEDWEVYKVQTIGTVCGVEFFDDDTYEDSGIYYQIKVESSQALFPDGRVLPCACDRVERIFAAHVTAINVAPFDAKVEVAA